MEHIITADAYFKACDIATLNQWKDNYQYLLEKERTGTAMGTDKLGRPELKTIMQAPWMVGPWTRGLQLVEAELASRSKTADVFVLENWE